MQARSSEGPWRPIEQVPNTPESSSTLRVDVFIPRRPFPRRLTHPSQAFSIRTVGERWCWMKQKRAALYVRVSSGEQHTEMQERALRDYVERRAWVLHKIYRDKCTGAAPSRPGLDHCDQPDEPVAEWLHGYCPRRDSHIPVLWRARSLLIPVPKALGRRAICRRWLRDRQGQTARV
jgi:hypothetical protein